MLTRMQVARRLGRSVATVRRMEGSALHPTKNQRGVWLFDEGEVDEVARDVAESGRALPESDDVGIPPSWPHDDRPAEHEVAAVPDVEEFEQAQRRIRGQGSEIGALRARIDSLEEAADSDLGDEDGDDPDRTSQGGALLLLLLGALGVALFILKCRRPTAPDP